MNDNIAGFVIDDEYIAGSPAKIMNVPVISFDDYAEISRHTQTSITVSLGEPIYRKMLSEKLTSRNLIEGTIILGDYLASDSSVGAGTILHAGSVVSSNCSVGKSCLINKRVIFGHDSTTGNYSVLSPNVTVGGHVAIGNNCFVGLGACIRDRVRIGNDVIVGMGAVVTRDIEDGVVVYGNPAKIIRRNEMHKVFR
jgi:sugar O-acyltransferase (sialic acid O-acetyltransferase NeuD family)